MINSPVGESPVHYYQAEEASAIEIYFNSFKSLSKLEKWEEIISLGTRALESAKSLNRPMDEAKICAQLSSTSFYQGHYQQALIYADRCQELSEAFVDPTLLIRAHYLKSAIHRALAAKESEEHLQQASYLRALELIEKAASLYFKLKFEDFNLLGKIYYNMGAAHADNPQGDLEKAASCYANALECFRHTHAVDDEIRANLRLGKVHLVQNNYYDCQRILGEVRPLISNERLAIHADYLEAQLRGAMRDLKNAIEIGERALAKAEKIGAEADASRLKTLLEKLKSEQR